MKKKIIILVSITVFILFMVISVIISANKTGVLNPISAVNNIFRILWIDEDIYVVAQEKPWKIMFAKPSVGEKTARDILDEYMKKDGYQLTDIMGSIHTYRNENGDERRINFSVNAYYSIWEWI